MNKTKTEQKSLFGDEDFVFNVLHTQLSGVNKSIGSCEKTISKKKSEIIAHNSEKAEIEKALRIVKKKRDALDRKTPPKK